MVGSPIAPGLDISAGNGSSVLLYVPDLVAVQSNIDYRRYLELGVPPEKLQIEANLKYDTTAAIEPLNLDTYGAGHIWIAASTVGPNEKGSLVAHQVDEDDLFSMPLRTLAVKSRTFS